LRAEFSVDLCCIGLNAARLSQGGREKVVKDGKHVDLLRGKGWKRKPYLAISLKSSIPLGGNVPLRTKLKGSTGLDSSARACLNKFSSSSAPVLSKVVICCIAVC